MPPWIGTSASAAAYRVDAVRTTIEGELAVLDVTTIQIVAHRQNIDRYKALLRTELTALERDFIRRRIAEEETELRRLNVGQRRSA